MGERLVVVSVYHFAPIYQLSLDIMQSIRVAVFKNERVIESAMGKCFWGCKWGCKDGSLKGQKTCCHLHWLSQKVSQRLSFSRSLPNLPSPLL